jgi:hypothetical protein
MINFRFLLFRFMMRAVLSLELTMLLSTLINIGSENFPFSQSNKIKTTNIVVLISALISTLYTLKFIFILNMPLVALINLIFTVTYLIPLFLNAKYLSKFANVDSLRH